MACRHRFCLLSWHHQLRVRKKCVLFLSHFVTAQTVPTGKLRMKEQWVFLEAIQMLILMSRFP
nr:hypothetical protein Iba_chr05aCG10790 [Ipomoea batatas]GMD87411.1 hypothetical protein Iba_chr14bCG15470 [Ipomoea batatas]GMD87412.1 hypothetical protein Iba_chr14bCG15480 [Ipomoea batatas]